MRVFARCCVQGSLWGLAALLWGCAADQHPRFALEPVGPVSGGRPSGRDTGTGFLEVYSRTDPYSSGGITFYRRTAYSVYTPERKRVKTVSNAGGYSDHRPFTLRLPAGRHLVYAESQRFGWVEVPVLILANRLTAVHLDDRDRRDLLGVPEELLVRLPDGRIAGRRAESPPSNPRPKP